jgi:hypothetical protein
MKKILVIKGADFSNVAVDHFDPTEIEMVHFNSVQDGKFKVNYDVDSSDGELQFLNLSSNPNAYPWRIIWRDVTEFRGKLISIGKTQALTDDRNQGIIFTNRLIDTVTNKDYAQTTYIISDVQLVSGYAGNTSDTPTTVKVPMTAVGLYIGVDVETTPEIHVVE